MKTMWTFYKAWILWINSKQTWKKKIVKFELKTHTNNKQ